MLLMQETDKREIMPEEIRKILGVDNSGISELCKRAEIKMKRNERGLTYFTSEDVQKLKDCSKVSLPSLLKGQENTSVSVPVDAIYSLTENIKKMERNVTDRLSSLLDEKLDGMDEVIMELIRVKTENESLRKKVNELNKENYGMKKEISSFKRIPFGFYAKKSTGKF